MMDSIGKECTHNSCDCKKDTSPVVMPVTPSAKLGRNIPCPCGSGKKYKKCCLDKREYTPGG